MYRYAVSPSGGTGSGLPLIFRLSRYARNPRFCTYSKHLHPGEQSQSAIDSSLSKESELMKQR